VSATVEVPRRAPVSAATARPRSRGAPRSRIRGARYASFYLAPALLIFLTFIIGPAIFVLFISFFNWDLLNASMSRFVGGSNYASLFTSSAFWQAVLVSVYFVGVAVSASVTFGLGIALLLSGAGSLPEELVEAAELDGASQLRFLWNIAAPLAWPAIITIGLYVFIGSWDSFLWPFIMTSSSSVQPIEVGLATFLGTNGTDWTGLSAAVVFTSLPIMVVFMVSQRRLVEGAFAGTGAVKG
jgi:ABC-type glycerol-3-phosphate transport system permease component